MTQKGFASNKSLNMDSFLHVDKEIEFIVDDSSSQYSFAVPTEKTLELSRKTYSKKNPITYHHYSSSPNKMKVNGNKSVTNACILNLRNSPVEQKKLLRGKRSKDSHPINSKPPKKLKRKETNDIKIINHKINVPESTNKFYKSASNPSLVLDPEVEIIEVKQNSPKSRSVGLLETNIQFTPNYSSAKGKVKDKLDILQRKKNALKMVPQQISEPCYPSNDEVMINEADTAPIMPSSDIPDGTVIEASNSMTNASTSMKWLSADGTDRFSQLNSDNSPATKGAKKDEEKILLPSENKIIGKNTKSRELRRLYANLNEISWFHEKSFQKLLGNRKGHIQHFDKNLRHIKSTVLHKLKRQPKRKTAAKIAALKKTKIATLKHKVPVKCLPIKQVNEKALVSKQISKMNTIKQKVNVIKKHGTSNLHTKKHIINQNNKKIIQNMKKGTKINSISKKYIDAKIRKENKKKGVKMSNGKKYINVRLKKENSNAGIKKGNISVKNKKENVSAKRKETINNDIKKTVNANPKKLIVMHTGNKKDNVLNTSDKKKVITSSEKKINSASISSKKISITAPLMKKASSVTPILKKASVVNISDKKLTATTNFKLSNTDPKNNIKKTTKVVPKIVFRGKNTTVPSSRIDFSVASGSGLQNACNIFKTDVFSPNPCAIKKASLLKDMYKNLEKVEISNEVDIYRKIISGEKEIYSAFQRGSKLRVTLEPLEHTDWWTDECYESVKKEMLQQALLKAIEKKDQESINAMFRELHESCINPQNNNKVTKKKRPEEEALRSSVRQSEGAFRYKEIVVKKHTNYMQFVLVPNPSKQNSLTIEAMKELKDAFLLAKRDSNCKAVLLNSSGSYFCSGIDLSQLIGANKKQAADEMAATIKDLVITLGHFTKPVVAAVNGTTIGFGVSLLTFCDVILASDKATFSIPATRLGYLPEGGITLTLPQLVGAGVATEMLLHGRRLTAEQALRHGLVSEVLWPTHLMNEVMPRIQTIVSQPLSVMETLKSMVRCHLWDKLKSHVERECRLLPPFWLDAQCQHNIKRTLQTGWLVD